MKSKAVVRYLAALAAIASIVGCDRVTKHIAAEMLAGAPAKSYWLDTVRLTYAENPGSFLSLGAGLPHFVRFGVFVVAAGLMLVFIAAYAIRHRWAGAELYGSALMIAGGTSNLIDRIVDGRVVDFLNVGLGPVRTGIFNLADAALTTGLLILALGWYRQARESRRSESGTG